MTAARSEPLSLPTGFLSRLEALDILTDPGRSPRPRFGYRTSNPLGAPGSAERGILTSRTDPHGRSVDYRWGAAFFVLIALTPNIPYVQLKSVGLALNDFPPILAVACGIVAVAARYRRGETLPVTLITLFTAQIALIAAASTVANGFLLVDLLAGPMRWIETTLIIGLAFILGSDRQLRSLFLRVAVVAAAADAVFGLAAWVTGYVGPNYLGIEPFANYQALYGVLPGRITGSLGLPSNGSGALFALALPIAAGYALGAKDRASRRRWLAVTGSFAAALVLTFSRVPIVLGVVLVVVLLAVRLRPSVALSAAVAFVVIVFASPLRDRFAGDNNDRLRLWATAVKMTRDNLLLGVGPAQYFEALPKYAVTQFGVATNTAHNSVLEAGATMGIFAGLLLALAMLWSLGWVSTAARLKRSHPEVFGAWLGLLGFFLASFTINYFFWPQLGLLYWVMAVALSRWSTEPATESGFEKRHPEMPVAARRAVVAGAGAASEPSASEHPAQ